nr:GNAT family N-acetyltransferase [uncultured Allomuricauda sp.]
MIKANPFTSSIFINLWSKHFLDNKEAGPFNFVKNISFYQSKIPGLYINAGKNLTKGLDLELGRSGKKEKGNCFLIHDVIDFDSNETIVKNTGLGHYAIKQYPGYLIELNAFKSSDDFMSKTFKKSSRYKLRKYKKRLEESFNISFKAYCGDISKHEYDSIFSSFRDLLEKRFAEKQISNNNLETEEWDFYKDVAFPMILEKKAVLFVLYNKDEPISITLGYLSDKRIFDAITVFDINFTKFHLGSIKIMYLVDWCIKNGWDILDFSKGHFDYKTRWANKKFDFYYHIWFDKKSIKARLISYALKQFYTFKQFLREKNVNEILHKVTYKLKHQESQRVQYHFEETKAEYHHNTMEEIAIASSENNLLKRICYDFLYLFPENESNVKIFQFTNERSLYLIKGKENESIVRINY